MHTYIYIYIYVHAYTHTHTYIHIYIYIYMHIYIYIYIYMCVCVCVCVCVCTFMQHFFDAYLNVHFCQYIFFNPFELPNRSYDIQRELVNKTSIITHFPLTFFSIFGHYLGYSLHICCNSCMFITTLLEERSYWGVV